MENSEQTPEDTNQPDPGYEEWLSDCKDLATDAGFRGILKAYFAGHSSEDYSDLAIGAKEILSHVVDGLLEENQDEDGAEDRLMDLIYPPAKEETKEETKNEHGGSCSFGVPNILQ